MTAAEVAERMEEAERRGYHMLVVLCPVSPELLLDRKLTLDEFERRVAAIVEHAIPEVLYP